MRSAVAVVLMAGGVVCAATGLAQAAPAPSGIADVPPQTALSFADTPSGTRVGTANQGEARPGLSIVKLYVADYMIRHGDGAPEDLELGQLATAAPVAVDGTHQNWGTGALPSVTGTKWGWSDDGASVVASASFGPDFSVAANTYGTAEQHTGDVLGASGTEPAPPAGMVPPR